jgi:hypothetical protein
LGELFLRAWNLLPGARLGIGEGGAKSGEGQQSGGKVGSWHENLSDNVTASRGVHARREQF